MNLEELKEEIEAKKSERDRLKGKLESIHEEWQKLDIISIEEAIQLVEEHKAKIKSLEDKKKKQETALLKLLPKEMQDEFAND